MSGIDTTENLWGYAKRQQFVANAIGTAFPRLSAAEVRILDVGCGTASQLGLPLARLGYDLTGIDVHAPSIAEANRQAANISNARFLNLSVDDMGDRLFGVVILSEVLEHVHEPGELLDKAIARLEKNGLLIVTVPNGYGEFEWDSWLFRNLGLEGLVAKYEERRAPRTVIASTENSDSRHIQFFTLRRLHQLFGEHRLRVVGKEASTLMAGPFVGHTLARSARFIEWNARIADKLPVSVASGWYFALKRTENGQ
jgi:SAM-dependent methyltransferase